MQPSFFDHIDITLWAVFVGIAQKWAVKVDTRGENRESLQIT